MVAFDLACAGPDDGPLWDFDGETKRAKANAHVREEQTLLLMRSPLCKALPHHMNLIQHAKDCSNKAYIIRHVAPNCTKYSTQPAACSCIDTHNVQAVCKYKKDAHSRTLGEHETSPHTCAKSIRNPRVSQSHVW